MTLSSSIRVHLYNGIETSVKPCTALLTCSALQTCLDFPGEKCFERSSKLPWTGSPFDDLQVCTTVHDYCVAYVKFYQLMYILRFIDSIAPRGL